MLFGFNVSVPLAPPSDQVGATAVAHPTTVKVTPSKSMMVSDGMPWNEPPEEPTRLSTAGTALIVMVFVTVVAPVNVRELARWSEPPSTTTV